MEVVGIACAILVYVQCCVSVVKRVFARESKQTKTKALVFDVGVFITLVLGLLAFKMLFTPLVGAIYAAVVTLGCFALGKRFKAAWLQAEMVVNLTDAFYVEEAPNSQCSLDTCAKAARMFDLTRREEEVLGYLLEQRSYAEISEALFVSNNTIKTHVKNIYRKVGVGQKQALIQKMQDVM